MSAPTHGYLKAEIIGIPFTFDGVMWTYPEEIPPEYELFFSHVKDLNSDEASEEIYHHTPLRTRAELMLKYAVGGEDGNLSRIVEEIPSNEWRKPLPPGFVYDRQRCERGCAMIVPEHLHSSHPLFAVITMSGGPIACAGG